MKDHEVQEAEELLIELSAYNIPYIAPKAQRVLELFDSFFRGNEQRRLRKERSMKYSREGYVPLAELSKLINVVGSIEPLRQEAYDEVGTCDRTQNDLLHALEFLPENESEETLVTIASELKEIRQMRRDAKDFNELTQPLATFISQHRRVFNELKRLMRETQEIKDRLDNRKYTPRELTPMEMAFSKVNIVTDIEESEARTIENE